VLLAIILLRIASRQAIHYMATTKIFDPSLAAGFFHARRMTNQDVKNDVANQDDDDDSIQVIHVSRVKNNPLVDLENVPMLYDVQNAGQIATVQPYQFLVAFVLTQSADPLVHPPT